MASIDKWRDVLPPPPSYSDVSSADDVYQNTSAAPTCNLPTVYQNTSAASTCNLPTVYQNTSAASTCNLPDVSPKTTLSRDGAIPPPYPGHTTVETAAYLEPVESAKRGASLTPNPVFTLALPTVPRDARHDTLEIQHSTPPNFREPSRSVPTDTGAQTAPPVPPHLSSSCQPHACPEQRSATNADHVNVDILGITGPSQQSESATIRLRVAKQERLSQLQQSFALNDMEATQVGCSCMCSKKFKFQTTQRLLIASKTGWRGIHTIFPLLSRYSREILVYIQLVVFATLLIFIIVNRTKETEWNILDIVNIALSGSATIIAIFNVVIVTCMQQCVLARRLMCCRKDNGIDKGMFIYFDLCPILLSEILAFPIFICGMFKFVLAFIKANNHFSDVPIGISVYASTGLVVLILHYAIRIIVAVFAFRETHIARSKPRSHLRIDIHFFIHMLLQMILQVIMIVVVGNEFYFENSFYKIFFQNASYYQIFSRNYTFGFASSNLIYMTIGTYVIPALGIVSFIVMNYYSIRQYPIAFFLDAIGRSGSGSIQVRKDYLYTKVDCCSKLCHTMNHCGLVMTSFVLSAIFLGFFGSVLNVCFYYTFVTPPAWRLYDLSGAAAVLLLNAGVILVTLLWCLFVGLVITGYCLLHCLIGGK